MSYGIIRVAKYKAGSVKGLEIHDQREKEHSHTNKDIDFSKSHLNYDLYNAESINYYQKVKERISQLALKKAVRKDAVVMCQCLVTSDKNFFMGLRPAEQKKFFEDAYNFVCHRFGKENIVSAVVHHDESTPHLHVNFVPVTNDGRLCAKDLIKKQDLIRLHDDFYEYNQSRGYNLERGESKEQFQKHLATEEFKLKKQAEHLIEEKRGLEKMQSAVKSEYKATESVLSKLGHFNTINSRKSVLRGKITLSESDYNKLQALAKQSFLIYDSWSENGELKKEIERLKRLYEQEKEKAQMSISEKLKISKDLASYQNTIHYLKSDIGELKREKNEILTGFEEYLKDNNLIENYMGYIKEQKEQEQSHVWDMEL
ncbi:plasmid recombination protein [Tyzzerella sp. OttesenSCG-928-J15]|nr:plasmid recombination protein [Tyzzerella sp. OttesenSCG-928-J15]